MTDSAIVLLTKQNRDLSRQMLTLALRTEALEKRVVALEQRLGAPARPKAQKLSPEEWLARKREAVKTATAHRWRKAKKPPKGERKTGHRRGKGRSK